MTKNEARKLRIYPTKEQETFFAENFGCARKVYNCLLDEFSGLMRSGCALSEFTLIKALRPLKEKYPYLREADSTALENAARNLFRAYENHKANPSHFGFPRFKSRKYSRKSYRSKYVNNNIRIDADARTVRLPKAGEVRYKGDPRIPENSRILSATVSRDPDGRYYVSLTLETVCENQAAAPEPTGENTLALDFSMSDFYVASDGTTGGDSRFLGRSQRKLKRAQRKLARTKKGSKRHEKARLVVAKIYRKAKNCRDDRNHKASRMIADNYDYAVVEDLNILGMEKFSKSFARRLAEHGWADFVRMLDYKLADKGGALIKVGRFFPSSQLCSVCGRKNPAVRDLNIREWTCPECGTVHDRDLNACKNLLAEGLRIYTAQACA